MVLFNIPSHSLKVKSSTLALLLTTELKVLAALQRQLVLLLAHTALHSQHNLLRGLGLLLEDGLGLATVALLLAVVATLAEDKEGGLAGLVLGDLLGGVLVALLAVRVAGLGNVHLQSVISNMLL